MEYNDDEYSRESNADELAQSQGSERVASFTSALPESSSSADSAKPSFRILSTPQLAQWVRVHNQMDVGCSGNSVWTVSSAKHGNGVHHLMRHHDLNNFWQSDGVLPHVIRIQIGQLTPVEAMAVYVNSAVDQSYSPRVIRVKAGTHEGDMTEVAKADIGPGQECGWVLIMLADMTGNDDEDLVVNRAKDDGGGVAGGVKAPHQQQVRPRQLDGSAPGAGPSGATSSFSTPIPYSEVAAALGHGNRTTSSSAGTQTFAEMPMIPHNTSNTADRWLWCTLIDICICENQFNGRDCHLRGIRLLGPRYEELERVSSAVATDMAAGPQSLRGGERLEGIADELRLR